MWPVRFQVLFFQPRRKIIRTEINSSIFPFQKKVQESSVIFFGSDIKSQEGVLPPQICPKELRASENTNFVIEKYQTCHTSWSKSLTLSLSLYQSFFLSPYYLTFISLSLKPHNTGWWDVRDNLLQTTQSEYPPLVVKLTLSVVFSIHSGSNLLQLYMSRTGSLIKEGKKKK